MTDIFDTFKSAMERSRKLDKEMEENRIMGQLIRAAHERREAGYGASITQGRGDQEVMRHLVETGQHALLKEWQTLPLFQFINGECNMDTWPTPPNLPDGMTRSQYGLQVISHAFDNFPFQRCIFYVVDLLIPLRAWFLADFQETEVTIKGFFRRPGDQLRPTNFTMHRQGQHYVGKQDASETFQHDFSCCAAYLQQCPDRSVEVRNAKPRAPAGSKTAKRKPWLRDDLPRIILIDPTQAPRYGCHAARESASDRKAPVPHARRGHWRRLPVTEARQEERIVFVRPSWIGPSEWENKGMVYKIIADKKQEAET